MGVIGQLAAGVAHDFNNLLTAVFGGCDLLSKDPEMGEEQLQRVNEIRRAGERGASLTRQLLAFGRRQELQPKVVDLNAVVRDMEKMLRRLIGENIELLTVSEPGLWRIEADPAQIEQVVMNLVLNARDAMAAGGECTLETANV